MATIDLTGAADLHCHFGPDAHRERSVDALDAARDAAAARHAAVVLKSHDYPTAALAAVVDRVVDGVRVFGGICCDREVGGVNPAAVETALRIGAKSVWLPTLTSRQDQLNGIGEQLGIPGPGLSVVEDDGSLSADTHAVLDLVAAHDAVSGRDRTRRPHDWRRTVHTGHRLRAEGERASRAGLPGLRRRAAGRGSRRTRDSPYGLRQPVRAPRSRSEIRPVGS